jgi:hypothetical protein
MRKPALFHCNLGDRAQVIEVLRVVILNNGIVEVTGSIPVGSTT